MSGYELLTLGEVATMCRTVISTARWWVHIGKLKSIKVGRRRLVRRVDLDAFLADCESRASGAGC